MNKQLELVKEFHEKFRVPVANSPTLIPKERSDFRFNLIRQEINEYNLGCEKEDLENISKELVDILYSVYGAILEHGLQDIMDEVFEEVHNSNLTRSYTPTKIIKGDGFKFAELSRFFN